MKVRHFFVAKFNSSRLKQFKYNINADYNTLYYNGEIVQLADCQVLRSIRRISGKFIDFNLVDELYRQKELLSKGNRNANNIKLKKQITNDINDILYVPEYITIKIDHKKHYEYLFENGLTLNEHKYYRFSCSAGQGRVSTVAFVREDILVELNRIMDNGRDLTKPLVPSKYNSYKGLATSSTFIVSKPRFCVIADYISSLDVDVDYVTETDYESDDIIERKIINMDFNRFDGMGIISPQQSKKWAEELGLDYIPAQWCIRNNFMKGMLCTFDKDAFINEKNNGNSFIKSIYGDIVDLNNIDVIITEGQFKLWDSFESLEVYNSNCDKNGWDWGISLYTREKDKDILKMNYQFLQTLNLNENDIKKVCEKFVNWVDGVNGNDIYYTLLFLMGIGVSSENVEKYFKSNDNHWVKALLLDHNLINDKYIRNKIYNLMTKKIKDACLGNIIVDGNFQVIVSDPYALMQYVCGHNVTGLLNKNEYYSNYWNKKDVKMVDSMRAPLTYRSEHVKLNLINNNECSKWYKYCYTGIIVNVHGNETQHWAGSDFDYDIIATTSDETIINSVYKNEVPIVYEPPKSEKKIIKEIDLYNADLFSFGSIIGQITNKSTTIYPLLNRFKDDSLEYKTLLNRLKMCTKLQSAQIDKAKIGKEVKGIPKSWTQFNQINKHDTESEIKEKEFYNKILLDKHPYFFIHLYKLTNDKYIKYIKSMDNKFKNKLNKSINELIDTRKYTISEKFMLDGYKKHLPIIDTPSVMNNLCKYIESINFDLKKRISDIDNKYDDLYKILMRNKYIYRMDVYRDILYVYNKIKVKRNDEGALNIKYTPSINKYNAEIDSYINGSVGLFKDLLADVTSNIYNIVDSLVYIMYVEKPNSNKFLLWEVFGDEILKNIIHNLKLTEIKIPVLDSNGSIEYLNNKFSLQKVNITEEGLI